jgi:signal peptidase II
MKIKRVARIILIIGILALNVGCDQVSKNIVRENINYGDRITLVKNFLTLTKVENTGAFLSLGNSLPQPFRFAVLAIFPIFILGLALAYLLLKKDISKISIFGISLLIGGGIGNIYDRIVYGSVTDFLHADFMLFQTGIFNFADISIMTGLFIIILEMLFRKPSHHEHSEMI